MLSQDQVESLKNPVTPRIGWDGKKKNIYEKKYIQPGKLIRGMDESRVKCLEL